MIKLKDLLKEGESETRDLKLLEKEGIVKRIGIGRRHLEYVLK